MLKVNAICKEYNVDINDFDQEAIQLIEDAKFYLLEFFAYIKNWYNNKITGKELNTIIKSNDIKMHFGFDVDGCKSYSFAEYLKIVGKSNIKNSNDNIIKFFEKEKMTKPIFVNYILKKVYVKEN